MKMPTRSHPLQQESAWVILPHPIPVFRPRTLSPHHRLPFDTAQDYHGSAYVDWIFRLPHATFHKRQGLVGGDAGGNIRTLVSIVP